MKVEQLIADLGLEPLPEEGGRFAQHFADENSTAIYFLVTPDDFSAMHRLSGPEVYHYYAGSPLEMLLLAPNGSVSEMRLGIDTVRGERPAGVVPAGYWQGSNTTGDWTLVGATMAPGFRPDMFELGDRDFLITQYPAAAKAITRLTRAT
jgi:predicted cupin superfamily sugar epimerase